MWDYYIKIVPSMFDHLIRQLVVSLKLNLIGMNTLQIPRKRALKLVFTSDVRKFNGAFSRK